MGQIQWISALAMFGLFVIAIISFMTGFANDNNAPISVSNSNDFTTLNSQVQGNLSSLSSGGSGTYNSIVNSTIDPGSSTVTSSAPFASTPLDALSTATSASSVAYSQIFGGDPSFQIFLTTFLGLLVTITALLVWKTWGGRNPE